MIFRAKYYLVVLRCPDNLFSLFWENKSKFVSLRRILSILSIILLIATTSQGQSRTLPGQEGPRVIKYYPNPATSFINFEIQPGTGNNMNLYVINFLGKQVYETKITATRTTVDLSSFTRGVYIFQLRDGNGKVVESGKFQVSK
ncbi:MAG: hypothetical protein B7Z54_08235 [Sphingobacteriales bacterium 12-47-4]|nr:MAG: hypothetical protein B7Z54_08235 [Sphingobacteriales bacterium 12-47-4]